MGYINIEHGGNRYHFHDGRFFSRHRDGYLHISAPIGAIVPRLAVGVIQLSVGGVTYYVTDDNYYRKIPDGFIVVDSPYR